LGNPREFGFRESRTCRHSENLTDIDILIGEIAFLGKGTGPKALRLLFSRLLATGAEFAGVGTSVSNRQAIRAFEKAGFRSFKNFDDPAFGACIYLTVDLRVATADPI
jgi:aminoglycoside 6'-N-acetyltransferase